MSMQNQFNDVELHLSVSTDDWNSTYFNISWNDGFDEHLHKINVKESSIYTRVQEVLNNALRYIVNEVTSKEKKNYE